ncbi:PAS domain-containing protein [Roseomonas stagni]|uniref:histidine kinase n=1 Tax=Falsiroseomonas algicola TaxID=2716930 RepID=A0A6M1LGN1_9PROT|nr:ATP-binding protein [Falsiroseomonas algicola]NGM19495.1 PAS domain-containing protein [Falsiroseomonas algicola]
MAAFALGAAWLHGDARGEARGTTAIATAERAARAARALVSLPLEGLADALGAAEQRQQAVARGDRPAQLVAERLLAEAMRRDALQFAAVTDAQGRIVWSSHPPLVGLSLAERESFALHRGGRSEPLMAPALLDLPGGPRSLLATRPLADPRGFVGIAVAAIDPRRLDRALGEAAVLPGLRLALLRADGMPLATGGIPLPAPIWPLPAPGTSASLRPAAEGLPALALASTPAGGDLLMLAALEDQASEPAWVLPLLAVMVVAGAVGVALLARPRPIPTPAGAALQDSLPAVAYRALIEPGGGMRLVEVGPAVERLTGWTAEAALRPGWRQRGIDMQTLPLGPDLPDRLRRETQASAEYRFRRADGAWMWLRETTRVTGRGAAGTEVSGVLEDISAERELALQAATAAKFATLGEMAAGLAHELNQPIAIMSLAAENAAEALEAGEDGVEEALTRLRRIMAQADRAKAIVTQLRAFSRVDVSALEAIDLGAAVHGMMVLAGQALRDAGVQVQLRLPDMLPPVVGQVILVEQVLLNLVLNARDALLERPAERRRLRIEAETGPLADEVTLRVRDSGPGLAPEVREKLFEPFYTTKPPGLGTGLGLSISRTIMRGIGGRITAENVAEGQEAGAEFTLVFRRAPLTAPEEEAAPPATRNPAPAPRWPAAT